MSFKRNLSNNNSNNSLPAKTSIFGSIKASKIGQGKYFTEGKFGHKKNAGLKGQLGRIKRSGRSVAKNLSKKNLNDIFGMVSDLLKKHTMGREACITRKDKKAIMANAEKLIYTKGANFSREDKKDLEKIVDSLRQQSKNNVLNKKCDTNSSKIETKFSTESDKINFKNSYSTPAKPSNDLLNNQNLKSINLNTKNQNEKEVKPKNTTNIQNPLEVDKEIEELRNQAKDLQI